MIDDVVSICEIGPYENRSFWLYENEINDKWVGKVPKGRLSWYKDMPVYFENSNCCPMRGSKRGIAARNGNLRYEYNYFFAKWLGRRFAKFFKKTGKRYFFLNSVRKLNEQQWNVKSRFDHEFSSGFVEEIKDYYGHEKVKILRVYNNGFPSKLCFYTSYGLNDKKAKILENLLNNYLSVDFLNNPGVFQ